MVGSGARKRGASSSSSTDASSRGGKKRAGGPGREVVASDTRKMEKALANAYCLSNACKQHTLANVEKVTWELEIDDEGVIGSTYAGFKKVLDDRRKLFKSVVSLIIHGVPVTQPNSNETYHIIEIKVGKKFVLELLFRQSDNYWIAFRHVSTEGKPVWEGWYYFKDNIVLPSFYVQRIKIDIESGYTDFDSIRIGRLIVSDVIKCLLAFDQKNYASKSFGSHNRVHLLQTVMVLFGECQRSGVFLDFAEKHFESVNSVLVSRLIKAPQLLV